MVGSKRSGSSTSSARTGPSIGFVGTYPPTQCGLATFTAALSGAMAPSCRRVGIVEVVDGDAPAPRPPVLHQWAQGDAASMAEAVEVLDTFDVVVVQHEYGIFGGTDGDEILDLLDDLARPSIVVLHTVLRQPSEHQRTIVERLATVCRAVVVMSVAARRRLLDRYDVDPAVVQVIPHGAADNRRPLPPPGDRPVILTWGLLGPGKGIEWVVDSLVELRGLDPAPRYIVAGQTHPKVRAAHGEVYRDALAERARALGVDHLVEFDGRYRTVAELNELIGASSVVVLPYDSADQVTSGVLVDALASGRPVVATGFPHAREALERGAGVVVGHRDSVGLGRAVRSLLTNRDRLEIMAAHARAQAAELLWPNVGSRYVALAQGLLPNSLASTVSA